MNELWSEKSSKNATSASDSAPLGRATRGCYDLGLATVLLSNETRVTEGSVQDFSDTLDGEFLR